MINKQAFTIMELMVVVIVIGVLAAFAIPNYKLAIERAEERQMVVNMQTIIAAQKIYKAKHDVYWPASVSGNHGVSCTPSERTKKTKLIPQATPPF